MKDGKLPSKAPKAKFVLVTAAVPICVAMLLFAMEALTAVPAIAASSPLAGDASVRALVTDGRVWKAPVFVETDDAGDAQAPQIAFDPSADARAVWTQSDGTRDRIWSNNYSSVAGWGIAVPIDSAGAASSVPQIALDPAGNAVATWVQSDGSHDRIMVRPYSSSDWVGIQTVDNPYGNVGDSSDPQVAIDARDFPLVVWRQFYGPHKHILWASGFTVNGYWSAGSPLDIESNPGDAAAPQIACDTNGNGFAVWEESDGTQNRIYANRYTHTSDNSFGTWLGAVAIDDATKVDVTNGDLSAPQVAFDTAGNALVAWSQFDPNSGRRRIFSNLYTAGNWVGATPIDTNAGGNSFAPQIAFDTSGNAIVVWQQFDGTRNNIWANRYTRANNWTGPTNVEGDGGDAFSPTVALDGNGNAVATWHQFDGSRFSVRANVYTVGSGWGAAAPIESDSAGAAFLPRVAFDANGTAVAVWYQSDGTRFNIKSTRFTREKQFGKAVLAAATGANLIFGEEVATDASGNAFAVWQQYQNNNFVTWWNRFVPGAVSGTGWSTPVPMEVGVGSLGDLQIAVQPDGTPIIAWSESTNGVWSKRYAAGTWGPRVHIDSVSGDFPQLAFDASGNAVAVWSRPLGGINGTTTFQNYSARSTGSSSWGTATQISPGPASPPLFKLNTNGNGLAVWHQFDPSGGPGQIWMNLYVAGQASQPARIDISAAGILTDSTYPADLAIGANGDALMVWQGYDGSTSSFYAWAQYYTAGMGWGQPHRLGSGAPGVIGAQVAFAPNGTAVAVWNQQDTPSSRWTIRFARYTPGGGSWSPDAFAVRPSSVTDQNLQQVAFDASGQAWLVWYQGDSTANGFFFRTWAARSVSGGGWNGEGAISTDTTHDATVPQIVVDANGNALVIWQQNNGATHDLWSNRPQ